MSDTPNRVERVLNLLAALLDTRVPLTRDELVREVAGYPTDPGAHRRAFERDKDILRGMGVPITTETVGSSHDTGYRVRPADYYLPDLELDPAETAALRVAVSAIALGDGAGEGALMKLGSEPAEAVAPIASLPLVPALAPLFDAFRRRAVVTFTHRGAARTVEPWGITSKRGYWYVVGRDRERDALRAFRADRIEGEVQVGEAGAFAPPEGFRAEDHVEDRPWLLGDDPPVAVRLRADAEQAPAVLAAFRGEATARAGPGGTTDVDVVVTNIAACCTIVLGLGDAVEVVEPPAVRAALVGRLRAIVATTPGTAP